MAGEVVYSNNNEDFDWDCPEECLQDWFDNTDEKDWPAVWTIFTGTTTDIKLIEPEGSVRVEPTGSIDYLMDLETEDCPNWIVKEG